MLLKAKYFKRIKTEESVTSSISCAQKYFEDAGTSDEELQFFWYNAARYGCVGVWLCGSHRIGP
jgi:hypothetical protein